MRYEFMMGYIAGVRIVGRLGLGLRCSLVACTLRLRFGFLRCIIAWPMISFTSSPVLVHIVSREPLLLTVPLS